MNLKKYDHFKIVPPYYDGHRLLSTPDRRGMRPEIFISTTNRSAGKSTFFSGKLVHDFIQKRKKFLLLYRNKYEILDAALPFFAEAKRAFYPDLAMSQETGIKNVYERLLIGPEGDDVPPELCGYATALRASEQIKKYSALLADVDVILFDEIFPEDDIYLPDEIRRFMSIHDSLARGRGSQARYLPCILVGNLINVFNPYYTSFGIVDDLQLETNFYRGIGFVVEQGFNAASAAAHKESAFHAALAAETYTAASQEKTYINTSSQFIDNKIVDSGLYMLTIAYSGGRYSVRYNESAGFYYVSDTPDPRFKIVHAATEADIDDTAIFDPLNRYRKLLKDRYRQNMVKCKNLSCRNALMHFLIGR